MNMQDMPASQTLDLAVVKAMGWRVEYWEDETDGEAHLVNGEGLHIGKWSADRNPKWRWSPSTDISAAWKLVDWLTTNLYFHLSYIGASDGAWTCVCGSEDSRVYAPTAPLAIVRAFLKANNVFDIDTGMPSDFKNW